MPVLLTRGPETPADLAARIAAHGAGGRRAGVPILGIDGRSGAGKSVLARQTAAILRAPVVTMDDLYPGWAGLREGIALLIRDVLAPLGRGEVAAVPQWDWHADRWADARPLPAPAQLIVEGVGACAPEVRPLLAVGVWLEVPEEVRFRRAHARAEDPVIDASGRSHWDDWVQQEDAYLASAGLPDAADLVVRDAGP